jgi:hypothetical protein
MRKTPLLMEQHWTEIRRRAFKSLKESLQVGTFLSFPDFTKSFVIATDASDVGIAAVLYQLSNPEAADVIKNRQWICFYARALHASECNYSTTRKELLAIVFALKRCHYFVWGRPFTLYTDHRALAYLFSQKTLSPIMYNWIDTILSYDFTIIHRPGILNVLPDTLSRLFPSCKLAPIPSQHSSGVELPSSEEKETNQSDPVPEGLRYSVIEKAHIQGHFGSKATVAALLAAGQHWQSIRRDVDDYIKSRRPCQLSNPIS